MYQPQAIPSPGIGDIPDHGAVVAPDVPGPAASAPSSRSGTTRTATGATPGTRC